MNPDSSMSLLYTLIALNSNECVADESMSESSKHEDTEYTHDNDEYSTDGV
jgi:hypothetical protein